MRRGFIDTWFLVARTSTADADHRDAVRLWQQWRRLDLITHDGVLGEYLTYFAPFGTVMRQRAAKTVRLLAAERIEVVAQDRALFLDALSLYERRPDKEYSLVDCMSMVVMEQRGITHVLTNDHHFTQAGFTIVNE